MYSVYHIIWILICALLIIASLIIIDRRKIALDKVLKFSCFFSVVSEAVKTISVFKFVPSSDGTMYYPYLELQYFPFHMCSILIFIIFYVTYSKNNKFKYYLISFLYPSSVLGGIAAILLPSIYSTSILPSESFTSPLAYQTFLYHSMLVVLGFSLLKDDNSGLNASSIKPAITIASIITFISLYLNSLFASPVYDGSNLISVEYTTNFFFTYRTPVGIKLVTKTQWGIYLIVLICVSLLLIYLTFVPLFVKEKKNHLSK